MTIRIFPVGPVLDVARKVKVDSYYLNLILTNLIANAVQAMPRVGKLTTKVKKEPESIVLAVKDTGVGIPKNVHSNVHNQIERTRLWFPGS